MARTSLLLFALASATAVVASAEITRTRVESYTVKPGTQIEVRIDGGPINVTIGETDQVRVELIQSVRTDSEEEADERIAATDAVIEKRGGHVRVVLDRSGSNRGLSWLRGNRGVRSSVSLVVPAEVDLNLDTSGGPITVEGEITGDLLADTSGGPISVTGATGRQSLDTSGGSISVERVHRFLNADTSGGSVRIGYVAPGVESVNADTSGGSISIGLDPAGGYDLVADTSGGGVHVENLPFEPRKKDRSHAEGKINGGGARVRADTSGGGIRIFASEG